MWSHATPSGTRWSIRCCANGSRARRSSQQNPARDRPSAAFGTPARQTIASLEQRLLRSALMMYLRLSSLVLVMGVAVSSSAMAQSEGKFAFGAQLSTRTAMGPENGGHLGVSFLWRFGQSKTGWGWHYGLNWFGTDMKRTIGGPNTEFGTLRVRPIMGGYGYTRVFGRTSVTGKLMG